MALGLHNLKPAPGSKTKRTRVGRGNASGRGTYSGRGGKGQTARTGGRKGLKRLGLKRMIQALPKRRGFTSLYEKPEIVNIGVIASKAMKGQVITPHALLSLGLIQSGRTGVKILGGGEISVALTFRGCGVTAPARAKIESAGGKIFLK